MAAFVAQRIEQNFFPLPDAFSWKEGKVQTISLSLMGKIQYVVANCLKLLVNLICLPVAILFSLAKWVFSPFSIKIKVFSGSVDPIEVLPRHFGFADSLFQTSGLGTRASATPLRGISIWDRWLNPKRIEGTSEGEFRQFFIDVLRNPQPLLQILREMNVTAHRFSLERAVIEPEKGVYDEEAVGLYRNFIQLLKANGIEPYVTLNHFVRPEWFDQEGGFTRLENVDNFKNYTLAMMQRFPEVEHWMPFNEINVDAFQSFVRGVYPPGIEGDIAGAARMMRNMLIAHCKIYKEAQEKIGRRELNGNIQIGSSHQWLKFEPVGGNPLEEIVCYFLSKITHYAVYNFFKTGQFSLQIPMKANVQLTIPKEEFEKANRFSDFIGVQFYGFPRLKLGFNGGKEYPGYKIKNFTFWKFGLTFGSSCPEGGEMMSFGPGFYPESLDACLTEAEALGKPIVISETGCDAMVQKFGAKEFKHNDEIQKRYVERIMPILAKHRAHITALFFWTWVRKHLEWDRGSTPTLGLIDVLRDRDRNIIDHRLSPAARHIQGLFRAKKESIDNLPEQEVI